MAGDWIYFVTNRNVLVKGGKEVGFGADLNSKSPVWLRYGAADMKPAPAGGDNDFVAKEVRIAPENVPIKPGETGPVVFGSDQVLGTLRDEMVANKADLVILVHGFACSFENAISNAASIKQHYSVRGRPVEVAVFSWPSDGTIDPLKFKYKSDRDDARSSAKAAARALLRLIDYVKALPVDKWCGRRIHLVAHSMGNYVLRNALQALISEYNEKVLPPIFSNIFLMAADEDDDAFEFDYKLSRLPELASAVHVYFATDDRALMISDITKFQPNRLGNGGPRTLTSLPHKIVLVDCSDVSDTDSFSEARHQYYRRRTEVIADVRMVLAGKAPEDIKPGRSWVAARRCFRIREA